MSNFHTLTNFFSSRTPVILHSGAANQLKMQIHSYIKDKPNYICDFKCNTATSKANISSGSLAPSFGFTVQQNKLVAGRYIVHTVKQHGYGNGRAPPHKYMTCLGTCQDATSYTNGCTMNFEVENGELTKFEHKYIMTKNEFHFADSNNDGKLTQEEHNASNHPADFGMLDKNNDGNVTIDEVNGNGTQPVTTIDCADYGLHGDGSGHAFGSDQQGWFCCSGKNYNPDIPSCSTTVGSNENMICVKYCSNIQCDVSFEARTLHTTGYVLALTTLNDNTLYDGSAVPFPVDLASGVQGNWGAGDTIRLWDFSIPPSRVVIYDGGYEAGGVNALTTLNDNTFYKGSAVHLASSMVFGGYPIKLWNVNTGKFVADLAVPWVAGVSPVINALTTLNDNTFYNGSAVSSCPRGCPVHIASGYDDGTIRLWNVSTGAGEHNILDASGTTVNALATLNDNTFHNGSAVHLASGGGLPHGGLGIIILWNVKTGKQVVKLNSGGFNCIKALTTLNDNTFHDGSAVHLASGDGTVARAGGDLWGAVKLWDVSNGTQVGKDLTSVDTCSVCALTTLNDGNIASGTCDGYDDPTRSVYSTNVKLWNVSTGACINTLKGHTSFVNTLTTLHDGNIASGSSDMTIRIWPTG